MTKMRFSPRPTSDQGLGMEGDDLAADFGADAAAGPGHHHPPPFQQPADVLRVQGHGIASQEVVDFDVADGDPLSPSKRSSKERMIFRFSPPRSQASIRLRSRWPGSVPATTNTSVVRVGGGDLFRRLPAGRGWEFGPVRGAELPSVPGTRAPGRANGNATGSDGREFRWTDRCPPAAPSGSPVAEHRTEHFPEHPPARPHGANMTIIMMQSRIKTQRGICSSSWKKKFTATRTHSDSTAARSKAVRSAKVT